MPVGSGIADQISSAMNQRLYDYASSNSSDSGSVSSASSNSSSRFCSSGCKHGLKGAARVVLAVVTLGGSELARKCLSSYNTRQAEPKPPQASKLI